MRFSFGFAALALIALPGIAMAETQNNNGVPQAVTGPEGPKTPTNMPPVAQGNRPGDGREARPQQDDRAPTTKLLAR